MASSHRLDLITSQQLAKLRLHRFFSDRQERFLSEMQEGMGIKSSGGQPTDTTARQAITWAWELAHTAQSCAYLAESLQCMAERSASMQIESPEWTFRRLLDSIVTLRALLAVMCAKLELGLKMEDEISLPVLSEHLVAEIRLQLAQGQAITTGAYMTSTKSQRMTDTPSAGDMK